MGTLKHFLLNQGLILLLALLALPVGFAFVLIGGITLVEAFPSHPFLCGLILLLLGAFLYACFVGSRLEARRTVRLLSRVVLLFSSLSAGLLSVELLTFGAVASGIAFSGHGNSLQDHLPLVGGLLLVSFCAAGIKHVFDLRTRYWILLVAVLILVGVAIVVVQGGIFLG